MASNQHCSQPQGISAESLALIAGYLDERDRDTREQPVRPAGPVVRQDRRVGQSVSTGRTPAASSHSGAADRHNRRPPSPRHVKVNADTHPSPSSQSSNGDHSGPRPRLLPLGLNDILGCAWCLLGVVIILSIVFVVYTVNSWVVGIGDSIGDYAAAGAEYVTSTCKRACLAVNWCSAPITDRNAGLKRSYTNAEYRHGLALESLQNVILRANDDAHRLPTINNVFLECSSHSTSNPADGCALSVAVVESLDQALSDFFKRLDYIDRYLERFILLAEAYSQHPEGSMPCWLRKVLRQDMCRMDHLAANTAALHTWLDQEREARNSLQKNHMLWQATGMSVTRVSRSVCSQVDSLITYQHAITKWGAVQGDPIDGREDFQSEPRQQQDLSVVMTAAERAEDISRLGCLGTISYIASIGDLRKSLEVDVRELDKLLERVMEIEASMWKYELDDLVSIARDYKDLVAELYRIG